MDGRTGGQGDRGTGVEEERGQVDTRVGQHEDRTTRDDRKTI